MKSVGIQFGIIRKYCSRIDRVSICMKETLQYRNYRWIEDVPADYDGLYLYGFGIIDSEFPGEHGKQIEKCIEIMLSEEPKIIEKSE